MALSAEFAEAFSEKLQVGSKYLTNTIVGYTIKSYNGEAVKRSDAFCGCYGLI